MRKIRLTDPILLYYYLDLGTSKSKFKLLPFDCCMCSSYCIFEQGLISLGKVPGVASNYSAESDVRL